MCACFTSLIQVATFEKPKGNPCKIDKPDTTVLSPYLKFGCISPRTFYTELLKVYASVKNYTKPPVSLLGQLYWYEPTSAHDLDEERATELFACVRFFVHGEQA